MRLDKIRLITTGLAVALTGACAAEPLDDEDTIASALEQENGGFTMEDEAPMFAMDEEFEDAAIEPETAYADPMEQDTEVVALMGAPDAVLFHTTVIWGQMPADFTNDTPRDWSGTLSVNRGAIVVRRVIGFEDATDGLEPRTDRRSLTLRTVTRPHHDGLRLTIVDPDPQSSEPLTLTYDPDDGAVFSITIDELVATPQSQVVDGADNRIVAHAIPMPVEVCNYGFLRGRWHRLVLGRGLFLGRVSDSDGELVGHVRGIYGRRLNGDQVFFGKYIDLEGKFKGIFRGQYDQGQFGGRWLQQSGERGVLGGEYLESIPGPRTGGHFLGRWHETSCNLPVPPQAG